MKSCHQPCLVFLLLFISFSLFAQDQRAFNQNSSRSNNTRAFNQNAARSNRGLSISFSPLYSLAAKSSTDSLLFRGSGAGFQFGADYFFGKAGISFSSGFGSSSPDDATINNFLKRFPFSPDELIITKARQQNMYMLLGPSVRFGSTVQLYAHAKGGLFINNSGLVSIQQKGAQRAVYRNESTAKSVYPGFLTGLRVQYSTRSDQWSFGIGADYMNTRSEVNNYDARRNGGIEALKLSRNITDIVTGITVRYNIRSPRDQASGQSSGKRQPGQPGYEDIKMTSREAGSGMASGKRSYQPGQPTYGNITSEEATTGNCGTVTQRVTNPDGTTEEMTFACPDDAAQYNSKMKIDGGMPNRISMNVTVPKQTQGATFGEKVNQGMHAAGGALAQKTTVPKQTQGATFGEKVNQGLQAAGSALAQGGSRNIISGKLSWVSASSTGIITNKTAAVSSVGSLSSGSGAAAASYARMSSSPGSGGVVTTMYAREAGSGMASGKRSRERGSGMATGKRSREAGSGMSTGRRQYEPVFADGQGGVCDPCIATAKLSTVKNNPLYKDKGLSGSNPMYEGKKAGGDDDCDGIAGMSVSLIEPESGAVIAKTITESCGDFFFANVPDGNYVVKLSGNFTGNKGYDITTTSKTDLLGKIELGDESMQLLINTGNDNDEMTQKAGISTSRSNIRNKSLTIIEADLDGDGEFESLRVLAELNDGTTRDITAMSRMSKTGTVKKVTVRGWDPEKKQGITGSASIVKEYSVSIDSDNKATLTNQYENGTKEDIAVVAKVSHHPGVVQFVVTPDEPGADSRLKTKTKSNQSNDRVAAGDMEENEIWSPRSNIKMIRLVAADLDGDGTPEMAVAAPFVPGGAVISAAMSPGNPIGGLTIKGGKNPGGILRTVQTDENGEFEYTGLEAGDYTFTIEQKIVIEDETFISVGGNNTKAQDHNSSRSNKTASVVSGGGDPDNGNTKVQDHNSSRSNKSSSAVAGDPDNGDDISRKGDVKITASQNSQSLRSISVMADTDGDGQYETDITGKVNDEIVLDQKGNITEPRQKAGISTSRSNIRSRNSLQPVTQNVYIGYGTGVINGKEVPVKTVYKVVEKATSGLKDTLKTQV